MTLDKQLDEILEKYEFGNFLKTPQQNYEEAKKAIKQLIEVITMQLQVEEFTKFYFEVKKDGDIDKYYDKRRIELANIYKGDE